MNTIYPMARRHKMVILFNRTKLFRIIDE